MIIFKLIVRLLSPQVPKKFQTEQLEKVLIKFSAENLLKFYLPSDSSSQPEFKLRSERLEIAIKEIKAKYSR